MRIEVIKEIKIGNITYTRNGKEKYSEPDKLSGASSKSHRLELFGVSLTGATREQLRKAFKKNGMQPIREDNRYWVDFYDPKGVLDGASEFSVGYVLVTNKFAVAQYKFPAFINTQLVEKVINMVSTKYGRPSSKIGHYSLGPVKAIWNMGQGMQIVVERAWPDTTTLLIFNDSTAHAQMEAEIDAGEKAMEHQKAKSQDKAF